VPPVPQRIAPLPGQESVWDYPRPPRLEPTDRRIRVVFAGETIADSRRAFRVLETSHPPVYYLPPDDVRVEVLERTERQSVCEYKGAAVYYTVRVGGRAAVDAAWCYPDPAPAFAPIARYVAFYPAAMDACYVDEEVATPQPGGFYGGWITSDIVGPFKGGPGSWGW
jgi:uncharacterized protein (DUF427 family)